MFDSAIDWLCLIPVAIILIVVFRSKNESNAEEVGPYNAKRDAEIERINERQEKQARAEALRLHKESPLYQAHAMHRKEFEKMQAYFTRDLDERANYHKMRDAMGKFGDED